ncbi:MAG TPA: hypothetical protein VM912_07920 [Terriglobales bacterium]|nr:hypothetical protein [Terriglobales bacterium]
MEQDIRRDTLATIASQMFTIREQLELGAVANIPLGTSQVIQRRPTITEMARANSG